MKYFSIILLSTVKKGGENMKSYLFECCQKDYQIVYSIMNEFRSMGFNAEIGNQRSYLERIAIIKQSDTVIFLVSKNTFIDDRASELYDDYQCCLDNEKPVQCVCLDNIDSINIRSLSISVYAFWSKIRKIQGINVNKPLNPLIIAHEIIRNQDNNEKRQFQTKKTAKALVIIAATTAVFLVATIIANHFSFTRIKQLDTINSVDQLSKGDHVIFGSYEQDGDISNGSEPIEWIVLDKQSDNALLISDKLLDYVSYNDNNASTTWFSSSLRKWMNEDFFNNAFTSAEKKKIAVSSVVNSPNTQYNTQGGPTTSDYIFALSESEVRKYFVSDHAMVAYTTEAARKKGFASSDGADYWWLRSPGKSGEYAAAVYDRGGIVTMGNIVSLDSVAVRPALWVNF